MKTGMNWQEFLTVAEKAESLKRDYEVKTDRLRAFPGGPTGIGLNLGNGQDTYRLSGVAHDQLATLCGIPRNYYGKMLQAHPSTLASLVNTHLHEDELPQERFVRTIGGKVRALLSTRYGILDHIHVARMLDQTLAGQDIELRSILCTERRLTFQFLAPRFQGEVAVGDVVQAGLAISNSEVGLGMFRVEALIYRLVCTNGMIKPSKGDWKLERVHRGTISLEDLRTFTQERVLALGQEFDSIINMTRRADGVFIPEENLPAVVDRVRRDHSLTLDESERALDHLYEEGRWTGWGMVNAVNYLAHSTADNDRSVELERISGAVLDQYY